VSVAAPATCGLVPGTVPVMVVVLVPDTVGAAVARPLDNGSFETVATEVSEEVHVTLVVISCVLESV